MDREPKLLSGAIRPSSRAMPAPTPPAAAAPPPGRLRIAYVTETYPPEINGVAHTVQRAVQWLCARGHTVQLVRPRQDCDENAASVVTPAQLLTGGMPIPMYPDLRMGLARPGLLQAAWRGQPPDLVHVATEGPLGWAALRAARQVGAPVSSDFRTNFHLYSAHYGFGLVKPVALAYLRRFHNATQLTTVPTRALRAALQAAGFRNLAVVGRGVDTALFAPVRRSDALRRAWGAEPGDPVALYVGRLAPEKNVALAVAAWKAMQRQNPRVKLVIVGDGPMRTRMARDCPQAVFVGWQRGEDLARCYASGDVFLFPSMTETFGNVVVEALASGLAVVAFAHGAAAEHVRDERDGLLARFDDAAHFVQQAQRAAVDGPLRNSIRAGAVKAAQSLSWDVILESLEQLLLRLARTAASSPVSGYAAPSVREPSRGSSR
jgi:glycosyltransferase involved in cell wall biosynthesis